MRRLRSTVAALALDALPFEWRLHHQWEAIHNRGERLTLDDRRGVRCDWKWTSSIQYCDLFPHAAARLLRVAAREWPIKFAETHSTPPQPRMTFVIGHRGTDRQPQLLATIATIAGQQAPVECLVVEQSAHPEVRDALPAWVRYLHQKVSSGTPYSRAAAFNAGVACARGDIVVLHDNDLLMPAAYATEILKHASRGVEAIDLKRFVFYLPAVDSARVVAARSVDPARRCDSVLQNAHGGSIAITKAAYDAIGGFDESFVGWGGEDVEFWERVETRKSTRFGYLPLVHLWHQSQPEKMTGHEAPAIANYYHLAAVAPEERILALRARHVGAGRQQALGSEPDA